MQNHEMKLQEQPFYLIKENIKEVEYRLDDEKRQKINVGDTITFHKVDNDLETIQVTVTELKHYKTLLEMYTDTFNMYLNNYYHTPLEAVKDTPYYTNDKIEQYGCLAILFKKTK